MTTQLSPSQKDHAENFAMLERAGIIKKRLFGYDFEEKVISEFEHWRLAKSQGIDTQPRTVYWLHNAPQISKGLFSSNPVAYVVVREGDQCRLKPTYNSSVASLASTRG